MQVIRLVEPIVARPSYATAAQIYVQDDSFAAVHSHAFAQGSADIAAAIRISDEQQRGRGLN
jgi:hypothetical protein